MKRLREYQREGVEFIAQKHRVILADDPGLGKTLTALTGVKKMNLAPGPILVVGPKISLGVWKREIKKWFGEDSLVYSGDYSPSERQRLWRVFKDEKVQWLIANYAMLKEIQELQRGWQAIIFDEIHLGGLLNHRSKTYKTVKGFSSRALLLLTGTPIRKGPQDLYGPLSLINPYRFSSYWNFVNEHCIVIHDMIGYTIEGRPKRPRELNELVKQYMIRHSKNKVLKELPPKIRQPLELTMTKNQARLYREMSSQMYMRTENGIMAAPSAAVQILRLRQLLVTPQLLGSNERGAALEALKELAETEFLAGRAIAVCTPFRQAVPFIEEILKELDCTVYLIHGGIKEPAASVADRFQKDSSARKAIVYTIKSGASYDAYSASTCFFIHYEWSAIDNIQAEDRLHRIGQTKTVNYYYFVHEGTVDNAVMAKLDEKTMSRNWILSTEEVLAASSKRLPTEKKKF